MPDTTPNRPSTLPDLVLSNTDWIAMTATTEDDSVPAPPPQSRRDRFEEAVRSLDRIVDSQPAPVEVIEDESEDDGSEEVALRYNEGKARFELIDPEFEKGVALVLTFGAEKYGDENWKKSAGTDKHYEFVSGCHGSLRRHLAAIRDGEHLDPESGLPHIDHVACNVMFIRYYDNFQALNNE